MEDDLTNAPLGEFVDPQSGIASILNQMSGTAARSRPIETIQNANRAVPTNWEEGMDVDDFIAMLLSGATSRRTGRPATPGGPMDLTAMYRGR